jgi:hypothetical protein
MDCDCLRMPTGLADGFGVGSRLCALAQYTPRGWFPRSRRCRDSAVCYRYSTGCEARQVGAAPDSPGLAGLEAAGSRERRRDTGGGKGSHKRGETRGLVARLPAIGLTHHLARPATNSSINPRGTVTDVVNQYK